MVDALHLVAIDRIPRPFKYVTFDHAHMSAAVELGLLLRLPQSLKSLFRPACSTTWMSNFELSLALASALS